jgi:hypothetical protein
MHVCKVVSSINSDNSYYIIFDYLDNINVKIDINDIINFIRLSYKINNIPYVLEYDNIEFEIIKKTDNLIKYKLLLTKLNYKLKLLPPNTDAEITILCKTEIDDPSLCICK